MKYSEILGNTFRAMKSKELWGFTALAALAIAAVYGAVLAIGSTIDVAPFATGLGLPAGESAVFAQLFMLYASLMLGGLLALPLILIVYAGFIHLSDEVLAGRTTTVSAGWRFGLHRAGRLLGIELVLYLVYLLAAVVVMIPLFGALFLGIGGAEDSAGVSAVAGVCFGYLWFLVTIIVIAVMHMSVEVLSVRYGLIGDRTFGDALSAGWTAFRARWKNVVVFSLIVLGLSYAWSMVISVITTPMSLFMMPGGFAGSDPSAEAMGQFMSTIWIIYAVMFVLMIPMYMFMGVAWTAFFRRLTGLDVPAYAMPAQPGYPPQGTPFGAFPQQPPAPPTQDPTAGHEYPQPPAPPVADHRPQPPAPPVAEPPQPPAPPVAEPQQPPAPPAGE